MAHCRYIKRVTRLAAILSYNLLYTDVVNSSYNNKYTMTQERQNEGHTSDKKYSYGTTFPLTQVISVFLPLQLLLL